MYINIVDYYNLFVYLVVIDGICLNLFKYKKIDKYTLIRYKLFVFLI